VASEREIKLRQALDTAGMLRSAHWASWATFEVVMGLESALLLCALGAAWQVRRSDPPVCLVSAAHAQGRRRNALT